METNDKVKFFAQYWGQPVLHTPGNDNLFILSKHNIDLDGRILLLKPLSSITDEDAIEVANIHGFNTEKYNPEAKDKIVYHVQGDADCRDYLRYKGYALPYLKYTVDQLQEMGWIKLSTK